ncbi:MAG TPA: NAD(P)H-dependent oxidoreductase subunit E [Clostridiales bacterium]|nr:NAD(P)H-dependent oxidoreductase subunit E [Clostridiales bacterium]
MSVTLKQAEQKDVELVDRIISAYEGQPGSLIPVLHETQKVLGFLPRWAQDRIAQRLNISPSEVNSVVSFYSLFSEKPKGKYCIGVCKGTACYVKNSEGIIEKLQKELGIEVGDTTDDGMYSLEVLRCLGACGLGPIVTVNEKVYTRMKPEKVRDMLRDIEDMEKRGE